MTGHTAWWFCITQKHWLPSYRLTALIILRSETKEVAHCILTFIGTAETLHYFIALLDTLKGNACETGKFHLQEAGMQNFHYIRRGGVLHMYSVCVFVLLKICILGGRLNSNLQTSSSVRDHFIWIICFEMIKSCFWSRNKSTRYSTVSGGMVCLN